MSGTGETKSNDVIGVMYVAIKFTEKNNVDLKYSYKKLRKNEAKRLQHCGIRGIDDIRPK